MPKTLEQLQDDRQKAIEANRARGVIPWENRQKQSDKIFEVVDGFHRVPAKPADGARGPQMICLGPGNRFHPTEDQVRTDSLRGKVRELTADEYRAVSRSQDPSRKPAVAGADIGIRTLPMSDTALKVALVGGLKEEDFEGVEPEGSDGRYTVKQVEAMADAKAASVAA